MIKICFRTVFIHDFMKKTLSDSILDLGKSLNRKRMKVKVHVFQLGHFERSKIEYESIFLIKSYIITILKKTIGAFCLYLKK